MGRLEGILGFWRRWKPLLLLQMERNRTLGEEGAMATFS